MAVDAPSLSWREALRVYTRKPVLVISLLGFSAGLPYLLVFSTLTAWLRDEGVTRTAIGFFAWVGLTYSVKVFWAPVVDRLALPFLKRLLGQRRSWIMLGQLGIAVGLALMSALNPLHELAVIALAALLVAFSSSTQDVAIDAFRIESAPDEEQGALSAGYIFGYRLALLVAGAGALYVAESSGWSAAYLAMAALMVPCVLATLWADEPAHRSAEEQRRMDAVMVDRVMGRPMHLDSRPLWQRQLLGAVVCPFLEFLQRYGRFALVVLLFVAVFRLSDIAMGIMANPFYLDIGYSKSEIASIAKVFGFFMTIGGSALCGVLVLRFGIFRPLLLGAVLVASTNLLFALLATQASGGPPPLVWLALVISADNLSGGIAGTAFIAYLSSLTHRSYTATQYALFSSLMTLPGKFISGFSGWVVDSAGYEIFFLVAAGLGVPAIVLALVVHRVARDREEAVTASADVTASGSA
jgi:PAT family beta-lactamase induction signal transducer AmpG